MLSTLTPAMQTPCSGLFPVLPISYGEEWVNEGRQVERRAENFFSLFPGGQTFHCMSQGRSTGNGLPFKMDIAG